MNITINIKAIADAARQDFRSGGEALSALGITHDGKELHDATAADISDYVMFAITDYVANLTDELEQELQDVVESLIITGETS